MNNQYIYIGENPKFRNKTCTRVGSDLGGKIILVIFSDPSLEGEQFRILKTNLAEYV
jgi:hypothetical protein